jgi:hypothetical protein
MSPPRCYLKLAGADSFFELGAEQFFVARPKNYEEPQPSSYMSVRPSVHPHGTDFHKI